MKLPSSLAAEKTNDFQTENLRENVIFSAENLLLTG